MNFVRITNNENLAAAVESSSKIFVNRITYAWQEDLWLRKKWNLCEENSNKLFMKEICFMINEEQIELLHPIMEEEPKCKVTFGHGNLQILSLILKFKLSDMKVTGTMHNYSSSKPLKCFPYVLLLKDVEFKITAGLIIRGDSFCIENYSKDYENFNVVLSYKTKDESKEIFPLEKIEDLTLRKSIENYIVDKFTKDVIIAVEDRIGEECVDTSVCSMLDNEYSYRNKLRLHNKKIISALQKLVSKIIEKINYNIESNKLTDICLPNLSGKLLEKENENGNFRATDGCLKNLASLQQLGDITVVQDEEDIIIHVFLFFSYLNITYKHISINKKDTEQAKSLETPENSNSSCLKIKIKNVDDKNVTLVFLDYIVDDIGYIEINWDVPENTIFQKSIEPEIAMWLNSTLEYKVIPIIEERIKAAVIETLKDKKLFSLILDLESSDKLYDSDPLNGSSDEDSSENHLNESEDNE